MAIDESTRSKESQEKLPPEHYIKAELELTRKIGAELLRTDAQVKAAFVSFMDGVISSRNEEE